MNHSCASCCPCCWPCCPCCCPPACCCDPADDGAGGLTDPPPNFRRNASLTCTLELRVQVCGSVRDSAAVSHAPQRRPVRPRRVVTRRGETRRCGSELRRRGGRRLPSSDGDGAARVGTSKAVVYLARSKSALPASQLCFVSANRSTERTVGVLSFPHSSVYLEPSPLLSAISPHARVEASCRSPSNLPPRREARTDEATTGNRRVATAHCLARPCCGPGTDRGRSPWRMQCNAVIDVN